MDSRTNRPKPRLVTGWPAWGQLEMLKCTAENSLEALGHREFQCICARGKTISTSVELEYLLLSSFKHDERGVRSGDMPSCSEHGLNVGFPLYTKGGNEGSIERQIDALTSALGTIAAEMRTLNSLLTGRPAQYIRRQ